jgi:hypothetical protein
MESPPLSAPFWRQGQSMCQVLEIDWKEAFYLHCCKSSRQPDRSRQENRRRRGDLLIWDFGASRILLVSLDLVLAIHECSSL